MNKIAIVGAIVLVIFGCVFVSGCTLMVDSKEKIVGTWECVYTNDDGLSTKVMFLFYKGGDGYCANVVDGIVPSLGKVVKFTWEKTADNTYVISLMTFDKNVTLKYNPTMDQFVDGLWGLTHVRLDPVVGLWKGIVKKSSDDAIKFIDVMKNDGSGYTICTYTDGIVNVFEISWKKNTNGTYMLNLSDGTTVTWTLNAAKDMATSSLGYTSNKVNYASTFPAIVGPWIHKDKAFVVMVNPDGTGSLYRGTTVNPTKFIWKSLENGQINVHYTSGIDSETGKNLLGFDSIWTYDAKNQVLISGAGTQYIRPTTNIDGFTILTN